MAGLIAIGVGCRRDCASDAIVALVRRALRDCPEGAGEPRLFSLADKSGEPGLSGAAATLGIAIEFLPREALAGAMPRAITRSAAARERFGLDSVAEAAALAGAGPNGRLLAPRIAADGATCAIAIAPSGEGAP